MSEIILNETETMNETETETETTETMNETENMSAENIIATIIKSALNSFLPYLKAAVDWGNIPVKRANTMKKALKALNILYRKNAIDVNKVLESIFENMKRSFDINKESHVFKSISIIDTVLREYHNKEFYVTYNVLIKHGYINDGWVDWYIAEYKVDCYYNLDGTPDNEYSEHDTPWYSECLYNQYVKTESLDSDDLDEFE